MTRIIVTGTDTGVGKTVFAAALSGAIGASYWKPVQAGLEEGGDRIVAEALGGLAPSRLIPEAYRLATPCSPHRAAQIDGIEIDPARLVPPRCEQPLVIEGAGGALVPLTRRLLYADLFAIWQAPAVIVARTSLGTINHSLMTIEALRSRAVPILGIAFVGDANEDSESTIAAMGNVRRLGRLPWLCELSRATLLEAFLGNLQKEDFIG
jgi:dethiobiotin synthetase